MTGSTRDSTGRSASGSVRESTGALVDASGVDRLHVARAAYDAVPLYDPMRTSVELDLTDNTNLWGLPPAAERVLRELSATAITRYPTLYASELKHELAAYVGVAADMIVTGCGSDDILDSALRAFGEPGDLVVSSDPSFGMIPIFARMNALEWRGIPELPSHQPDVDALLATGARIMYLCSPNNPTGELVARDAIERVIAGAVGVVIIDEAYAEFAEVSSVDLLRRSNQVLIVRTMSKAFGLAGLRVGYAVGQTALVREVEKSRGPYKLNAAGERMAVAALQHDVSWVRDHAHQAAQMRDRLASALRAIGLSPLASHANFVCVPVRNCALVSQALRARGVAARPFPRLPHIGDALRISVGPWPLLETFLAALEPALREVNG